MSGHVTTLWQVMWKHCDRQCDNIVIGHVTTLSQASDNIMTGHVTTLWQVMFCCIYHTIKKVQDFDAGCWKSCIHELNWTDHLGLVSFVGNDTLSIVLLAGYNSHQLDMNLTNRPYLLNYNSVFQSDFFVRKPPICSILLSESYSAMINSAFSAAIPRMRKMQCPKKCMIIGISIYFAPLVSLKSKLYIAQKISNSVSKCLNLLHLWK